ncbi:MAG: hypothetical protein ACXWZZ_10480, partial [Solirubrobacteraceae bacterium]
IDRAGHRTVLVRTGPELDSCPRELDRVRPGPTVPRRRFFGACNQRALTREVTPGTSVGWADVYPSKSNEANNVSSKIVRVPFNPGAQHCPRRAPPAPPAPASPDPAAG